METRKPPDDLSYPLEKLKIVGVSVMTRKTWLLFYAQQSRNQGVINSSLDARRHIRPLT